MHDIDSMLLTDIGSTLVEAWINMDLRDVNWLLVSVCKYLSASPHRVQEPLTQPMKFLFTTV